MNVTTGELITTIFHNEDNTKTFEIKREFKNVEGEDIILLQLFPTLGEGDEFTMDSTCRYIVNHRKELNIKSIRFINLFAKRCSARLSTRNISLDKENIDYIENLMRDKEFKKQRFVIAYGCSMENCAVANQTKKKILEMFEKYNPKGEIYQISVDKLESKNESGVHILFLGIRYSSYVWKYEKFSRNNIIQNEKRDKRVARKISKKGED